MSEANAGKKWTPEEDDYLRHWVGVCGIHYWNIGRDLERSPKQVAARCYKLKIKPGKMEREEYKPVVDNFPAPTGVWQSMDSVPVNEPVLLLQEIEDLMDWNNPDAPPKKHLVPWAGTLVKPMRGKAKWHDIDESMEADFAGKLIGWMPFPRGPHRFAGSVEKSVESAPLDNVTLIFQDVSADM